MAVLDNMKTHQPDKTDKTDRWVITFPAQISEKVGQPTSFLLSTRQVIAVLDTVPTWSLPTLSSTKDEIGLFNDEFLPVIDLETHLGFENEITTSGKRMLVVRAPSRSPDCSGSLKALIRVDRHMQNIPLPEECEPLSSLPAIPDMRAVQGIYECNQQIFIVMDLEEILNGYHTTTASAVAERQVIEACHHTQKQ